MYNKMPSTIPIIKENGRPIVSRLVCSYSRSGIIKMGESYKDTPTVYSGRKRYFCVFGRWI